MIKCWKKSYFALIQGSLIAFSDKESCQEFKNSIYSNDYYYNAAFHKFVTKSMPMIDPEIEKKDHSEIDNYKYSATSTLLESLKIFTISTSFGEWYFGAEDATSFLFWCQSFHKYCRGNQIKINKLFSDNINNKTVIQSILDDKRNNDEIKENDNEPNLMLNIEDDLIAINDEEEVSDDDIDKNIHKNGKINKKDKNNKKRISKRISGNILLAVNLDEATVSLMDSKSEPAKTSHFGGSQSLQLTGFTPKELLGDDVDNDFIKYMDANKNDNDESKIDDDDIEDTEYKDFVDETVYTTETDESEDEIDCLDQTMTENEHHLREHTLTAASATHFIIDDD